MTDFKVTELPTQKHYFRVKIPNDNEPRNEWYVDFEVETRIHYENTGVVQVRCTSGQIENGIMGCLVLEALQSLTKHLTEQLGWTL